MKKFPINVNLNLEVDQEYIDDVLCAAFEGGISYWAVSASPVDGDFKGGEFASEVISRGGIVMITEDEEGDGAVHLLTLDKTLKGIASLISKFGTAYLDAGYVDADKADYIVQMALFDEIVYG